MTVRAILDADLPAIVALFAASPLAVLGDLTDAEFTRGERIIVNDSAGVINACVFAGADTSAVKHAVFYRLVFGTLNVAGLLGIIACLKDTANWGKSIGIMSWYASIPQGAAFSAFRAYLEGRWPYLHTDPALLNYDAGQPFRLMGDTLDSVLVNA